MKRRYMRYLFEPTAEVPRTSAYRKRRQLQQKAPEAETPVTATSCNPRESPVRLRPVNFDLEEINSSGALENLSHTTGSVFTSRETELMSLEDINDSCCSGTTADVSENTEVNIHFVSQSQAELTNDQAEVPLHNDCEPEDDSPLFEESLCPCITATVGDVYLMTLALGLRHNLTWTAQLDIIKMVNQLYGRNVLPETKHHYFNHVKSENIETSTHYYCPGCQVPIQKFKKDGSFLCACDEIVFEDKAPYFVTLNLEIQMKRLFEEPSVGKSLMSHRFTRAKVNSNALEDIYDGRQYKHHLKEGGILVSPHNFSYSFNTDGVKAGNSCSKNKTMWPIFITLNELPFSERKRNMLLAGLYVGSTHPNMNTFLEPFVDQANRLSTQGINWTDVNGQTVNSKVIPLCCVVDSPARSSMLQMNSFNSKYGCTFCYQKTERVGNKGRRFGGRQLADLRTHALTLIDMQTAFEKRNVRNKTKRRHKGVWRPSVLMNLNYFDLVKGFVPDYMHALLLGVVRQHTEILLDPQQKERFWENMNDDVGMEHLIALMDTNLTLINPPHCITRLPRSLSDRALWKASEWRSWLLFYAIVCFMGDLKEKYLTHFSMLSVATSILLQKSVTHEELEYAETLICKYCFYYEEYFGSEAMNCCVHLLLHVVEGVRNMGPLWTHNSFIYEGQNRFLLQLLASPRKVATQLSTKYMTYMSLGILSKKLPSNQTSIEFCENVTGKQLKFYRHFNEALLIGDGSTFTPSHEEIDLLLQNNLWTENIKAFEKCIVNHYRCSTAIYSAGKRNNDSVVCTADGKMYSILHFILCDSKKPLNLAQEISVEHTNVLSNNHVHQSHILTVLDILPSLTLLKPQDLLCLCILMDLPQGTFVSRIPFGCMGD